MHEPALINPLEEENWNNLLISTPGYSFFHTSNWADVLSKSYNYKPFYLCTRKENTFISLLPVMEVNSALTGRRGVCLPFTDTCEPIAENAEQFQKLFDQVVVMGRKRKWKYLEIRGGEKYLSAEKPSQLFFGHTLDLSCGQQQLFSNLRDSTRRNIKKAQNENINVTISTSPQSMKDFYRLNTMTRREHGLPPQPYKFFQHLYDHVITGNMGFIATASLSGSTIAANVYLNFGKEVIYKYGASDKAFQHLRANNLVMWEAIKWSADHGFEKLCFGRTEPENEGLMQFKAGWGVKPYQIYYYRYDLQKNVFTSNSSDINPLFNKFFSKLPIPVLEMLGKILYRHMG
jgi:lipid II:glycine glycyltransferase (peptidoglycan interpeptide bridge formation enzyme)